MLHDIPWKLKCNASQARKIQTVTLKSRLSIRYVHDHAYLFLKPGSKKLERVVDRVIINRHKKGKEAEAKVQERDKTKVKKIDQNVQ